MVALLFLIRRRRRRAVFVHEQIIMSVVEVLLLVVVVQRHGDQLVRLILLVLGCVLRRLRAAPPRSVRPLCAAPDGGAARPANIRTAARAATRAAARAAYERLRKLKLGYIFFDLSLKYKLMLGLEK